MHPFAYMLENVLSLEDFLLLVLATWQQIKAWIGDSVDVD
jgi:hypothetical protein